MSRLRGWMAESLRERGGVAAVTDRFAAELHGRDGASARCPDGSEAASRFFIGFSRPGAQERHRENEERRSPLKGGGPAGRMPALRLPALRLFSCCCSLCQKAPSILRLRSDSVALKNSDHVHERVDQRLVVFVDVFETLPGSSRPRRENHDVVAEKRAIAQAALRSVPMSFVDVALRKYFFERLDRIEGGSCR